MTSLVPPAALTTAFPHVVFSLCILTRQSSPTTFALVHETKRRGWWLPGGAVDDGETFLAAGAREAREEAGCDFINPRLLCVQQSHGRIRWFLHGEVPEPALLKTEADEESLEAKWVTLEQTRQIALGSCPGIAECHLRGDEPLTWFAHVLEHGSHELGTRVSLQAEPGAINMEGRWVYRTLLEARAVVPTEPNMFAVDEAVLAKSEAVRLPRFVSSSGTVTQLAQEGLSPDSALQGIALLFHHLKRDGTGVFGAVFVVVARNGQPKRQAHAPYDKFEDPIDRQALDNYLAKAALPINCLLHLEH